MIWLFIPLSILTLWLDHRFWRGRLRHGEQAWMLLLSLTALLPLLTELWARWIAPDNTTPLSLIWMWLTWIYLFTVPSRLILYAGWWSKRKGLRWGAVGLTLLYIALLLQGTLYGRTDLRIEEQEVRSPRIPKGWDGARILLLSDLHIGTMLSPERECRTLVDQINALKPDMLLFAGDFVHIRHNELDHKSQAILSEIKAPLGIYSVLGNHDIGVYIKDSLHLPHAESMTCLLEKQIQMGWRPLSNESLSLVRHGDTLLLGGIPFNPTWRNLRHASELPPWPEMEAFLRGLDTTRFTIILSHLPQLWEPILNLSAADMTLSGHVHSMQHKLPIGQRGLSLARLKFRHWSGRYEKGQRILYINDGIGSIGIPARFGATPELTLFTLRSLPAK